MVRLRADVTFDLEAETLAAGGSRLRELAEAARQVGFELVTGKIGEAPAGDASDDDGWTPYGLLT